jgi:hypothetical protein
MNKSAGMIVAVSRVCKHLEREVPALSIELGMNGTSEMTNTLATTRSTPSLTVQCDV